MATFTRNWSAASPTDSDYANEIDNFMRNLRVDVSDRLADIIYGFTAGENDGLPGIKEAIFKQQASAPGTPNADEIVLYALDDGINCGLYAKQEDGYLCQILKKVGTTLRLNGAVIAAIAAGAYAADSIDEDDIRLANNAYLTARNQAGDGDVNLIKAGANNLPTLPDSAEMASDAAPVEDEAITNKKYVDDRDASAGFWHTDGSTVFNTSMTAANTFQDLDLSAKVGSNAALVFLEVHNNGSDLFVCKPKGYGSATFSKHNPGADTQGFGCCLIDHNTDDYGYVTVATDSSGVIQIGSGSNSETFTIKLVGYVK